MGQNQKNTQEPDMNQLRKVRREKLAELQQNGRDPFQITKFNQTHHSLEVKDLYEAHEAEILKDHQQPNVEGMDEEQAKEALKNDYEERRRCKPDPRSNRRTYDVQESYGKSFFL